MNKIKRQIDIIYNNHTKKDITIIHISDLHFNKYTKVKKLNLIKEEIIKNNPDYIMITGDLLDEPSITKDKLKIKELLQFLTNLAKHAKLFISIGNHDVFTNSDFKFFDNLNDLKDIYVLNNKSYQDEFIYISGITQPYNYYYNINHDESSQVLSEHLNNHQELIKKLPEKLPKVTLIHSPICLSEKEILNALISYDLILSGHTHNGMVPDIISKLFKTNQGIIAPNKKIFPKIARGKIEKYLNNKLITIIISGGITKLSSFSSSFLSKLNFLYNISINKIIITKKRGKYYE